MKKVLHVNIGSNFGGIEKLQMDYMKYISHNYKIDILMPENKTGIDTFCSLNVSRNSRKNKLIYDYRLYKFLKKNKYDIVHINSATFFFTFRVALISKLCGVKHVIAHSHGHVKEKGIKGFFVNVLNPLFRLFVDEYISCSMQASESLLTNSFINKNKVHILKNGIEIEDYIFNENTRNEYRNILKVDGKIVYGHIGRMFAEKNHDFLIDIFYEIQKLQDNAMLVLVGSGDLEEKIRDKVKRLQIESKVIFLGFRNDTERILNALDVFIFPSLNEGFGLVAIEAQTNGLPTYCSTALPQEANISPYFKTFNLNDKPELIAKNICEGEINYDRKNAYKNTIEKGCDIKDVCKSLEEIYDNILR